MSFLRHGKSIDPMSGRKNAGAGVAPAPALIGLDEFQLAIPRRVGLHQSPPPLYQPGAVCSKLGFPVELFTANGKLSLNCLSHPRGQAQGFLTILIVSGERAETLYSPELRALTP